MGGDEKDTSPKDSWGARTASVIPAGPLGNQPGGYFEQAFPAEIREGLEYSLLSRGTRRYDCLGETDLGDLYIG